MAWKKQMATFGIVAFGLLGAATLFSGTENSGRDLAKAHEMWDTNGPDRYRLMYMAESDSDTWPMPSVEEREMTVEAVFDQIETAMEDGTLMSVEYHPAMGYPTRYEVSRYQDRQQPVAFSVEHFEPMSDS